MILRRVVRLLAISHILCLTLNAQVSSGSLSGTVADTASQAPIPDAQVRLIHMGTGVARTVATDNAGFYTAPDLLPGTYEMTVAAPAFTTQVRTGIAVNVGASLFLNVVMQAGDPARVVRLAVSGTSGDSSAVGGNVGTSTVVDSPLNGRDWTQLATLQAGVTGVQTGSAQGGGNSQRGFGAALSISGARPDQNSYRLDGVSINDYSNGAPVSVLGDNLGVDAEIVTQNTSWRSVRVVVDAHAIGAIVILIRPGAGNAQGCSKTALHVASSLGGPR